MTSLVEGLDKIWTWNAYHHEKGHIPWTFSTGVVKSSSNQKTTRGLFGCNDGGSKNGCHAIVHGSHAAGQLIMVKLMYLNPQCFLSERTSSENHLDTGGVIFNRLLLKNSERVL
jgi:hypothetical protein